MDSWLARAVRTIDPTLDTTLFEVDPARSVNGSSAVDAKLAKRSGRTPGASRHRASQINSSSSRTSRARRQPVGWAARCAFIRAFICSRAAARSLSSSRPSPLESKRSSIFARTFARISWRTARISSFAAARSSALRTPSWFVSNRFMIRACTLRRTAPPRCTRPSARAEVPSGRLPS
ncbi:MAG: hypothetical protein U0575_09820 [Phycisphaerales bacterium]